VTCVCGKCECPEEIPLVLRTGKPSEQQVGGTHYKDFVIQPAEFVHKNSIGFLEGNAIKYLCRHKAKNGKDDLLKARHYIDLLLEWEYK
jgi:hypothetical protein